MKTAIYLSILWIFFTVSSVAWAQKVTATVSYDSKTKTVFIDVTNNSDEKMFLLNGIDPSPFSEIFLVLKNSQQETVYNNMMRRTRFILKDASMAKNLYLIPPKSTSVFTCKIGGYLEYLDKEQIKTIREVSLMVEVKYILEKMIASEYRPIQIEKTFDF